MEPGTIQKINTFVKTFENINKSKQIIEIAVEKYKKKISSLKKLLAKEQEKNSELLLKLENFKGIEEKLKNIEVELSYKNKKIEKLNEEIYKFQEDESDSDTWKQLYETTRYSKMSSNADYLEITHSIRELLEKISDSGHLKHFINSRKHLLIEIKNLSSTLNFEKILHHICSLCSEMINYYEEVLQGSSTLESEAMSTPNQKFKFY